MEFTDKQAIYLQIADYVCEHILTKKWLPGDRIPSTRELGSKLEVNPNTVMRAYEFLKNQEIIHDQRGIGFFISDEAQNKVLAYRKAQFLEQDLPQFLKTLALLGMNIDDLKTLQTC